MNFGAGNRTRTGDIHLGKVALYQLSYSRSLDGMLPRTPNIQAAYTASRGRVSR